MLKAQIIVPEQSGSETWQALKNNQKEVIRMEHSVILGVEHKPEVDALLSGLKGFDSEQKSYILGVIDGTAAQIARQSSQSAHPTPAA